MVATVTQAIKARREPRVLFLFDSGGLEFSKMSTEQSKTRQSQHYSGRKDKAPMVPMMVTVPLQLVHLDFTSFEMTKDLNESPKVKQILVIVDHFMRYTRAYVTKDQEALTAAKTLEVQMVHFHFWGT